MRAAELSVHYFEAASERRVAPTAAALSALRRFHEPLPRTGCDPADVLELLDDVGSPATVTSTGGRNFGFVTGATLPTSLAANWLAGAWDQNAAMRAMSPLNWKTLRSDGSANRSDCRSTAPAAS